MSNYNSFSSPSLNLAINRWTKPSLFVQGNPQIMLETSPVGSEMSTGAKIHQNKWLGRNAEVDQIILESVLMVYLSSLSYPYFYYCFLFLLT